MTVMIRFCYLFLSGFHKTPGAKSPSVYLGDTLLIQSTIVTSHRSACLVPFAFVAVCSGIKIQLLNRPEGNSKFIIQSSLP
jgi:hypothetical protein